MATTFASEVFICALASALALVSTAFASFTQISFALPAMSSQRSFATACWGLRFGNPRLVAGLRRWLSAAQSKTILDGLRSRGQGTDIFDRHLALEEAIVGSPPTADLERWFELAERSGPTAALKPMSRWSIRA